MEISHGYYYSEVFIYCFRIQVGLDICSISQFMVLDAMKYTQVHLQMKRLRYVYFVSTILPLWFASFADSHCSGLRTCQFRAMEVTFHGIHPCPLELSSYLEASYSCVPSKFEISADILHSLICKALQVHILNVVVVAVWVTASKSDIFENSKK